MHVSNSARIRQQVRFLQRQFLQDGELPFADILSAEALSETLSTAEVVWKDRIYSPLVTLWVFLSQVLSADHSCRAAAARLIAHRLSRGESECSADTGAYCQARKRLPETFLFHGGLPVGRVLDSQGRIRNGFGKVVAFTCLMARPSPWRIRQRTKKPIHRFRLRGLAWDLRSPEWGRSFLYPAVR